MKNKFIFFIAFSLICLNMFGCAPLIIGSAVGVVGGYAASTDTIQGITDISYEGIWDAALKVSRIRGVIKQEDYARGYLELEADSSRVWIRLVRLTRASTRVRVSSRKYRLPNLALAQDIYTKIMEEVRAN